MVNDTETQLASAMGSINNETATIDNDAAAMGQSAAPVYGPLSQDTAVAASYAAYGDFQFAGAAPELALGEQSIAQQEGGFLQDIQDYPDPPYPPPDYASFDQSIQSEEYNLATDIASTVNLDDASGVILPQTSAGTVNSEPPPPEGVTPSSYQLYPTTQEPASTITDSDVLTNGDGSVFPDYLHDPIPAVNAGTPPDVQSSDPNAPLVTIDDTSVVSSIASAIGTAIGAATDIVWQNPSNTAKDR